MPHRQGQQIVTWNLQGCKPKWTFSLCKLISSDVCCSNRKLARSQEGGGNNISGRTYRILGKQANKAVTGQMGEGRTSQGKDCHNPFCRVRNCPHELRYSLKEWVESQSWMSEIKVHALSYPCAIGMVWNSGRLQGRGVLRQRTGPCKPNLPFSLLNGLFILGFKGSLNSSGIEWKICLCLFFLEQRSHNFHQIPHRFTPKAPKWSSFPGSTKQGLGVATLAVAGTGPCAASGYYELWYSSLRVAR